MLRVAERVLYVPLSCFLYAVVHVSIISIAFFFSVFNINPRKHLCVLWISRWQLVFNEEPKGETEDDNANDPFVLLHGITLDERTNHIV